jgi:plastocyanin
MFVPLATSTRPPSAPGRRILTIALLGLVLLALVVAGFLLSPPGQRFFANPADAAPVTGINEVLVQADPRQNHVFAPAAIQVPVGTTVTWRFEDVDGDGGPVPHNVVFEGFGSEVLATGSFAHTFTEPGSYTYACTLHAFMQGRVEVVNQ